MTDALGWHVGLKLEDERVLARTDGERRTLARAVLEHGRGFGLFVFGAADNHLHAGVAASRRDAGTFAHRVECSLRHRLELRISFRPAYIKPIADQRHAYSLFRYCLRQEAHHGTESDRFHDASNLPDLLGLRLLGTYTAATVRALLPRIGRGELETMLGVAELHAVEPRLRLLPDAAAAALGVADLQGEAHDVVLARRAAVQVAGRSTTAAQLMGYLGVSKRTLSRLRSQPVDAALVRAVDLQLRLRSIPRPVASENITPTRADAPFWT